MQRAPILAAVALAGTLAACPNWNRERCETPSTQADECRAVPNGTQPFLCSPSRERTPVGDEPCEANPSQTCVIAADGMAHCAPRVAADAGVR
jgi:hypothetical protein